MFWLIGAMIAVVCALLLACVILILHGWDVYPLRTVTRIVHRPLFEFLLIAFMVGGIVEYAATKGTNGNDRAGQPSRAPISDSGSSRQDGGTELTRQAGEITNLCFTGISVCSNVATLEVSWPTNFFADGTILDYFAKPYALNRVWQWIGCRDALPGMTNLVVTVDTTDIEGVTNHPSAVFFKVQDRLSCATTMADADGDGLPDVYELQNGTNPYVPDYESAPKITVGTDGAYSSVESALAVSQPYSLISLAGEEWSLNQSLRMPSHPVMLVGPDGGYAVLRSSALIGAVMLDQGQDARTLFRNLYLVLEAQNSFQAGFWVGGNLPWSGLGASPTFENIRIRAMYPNTLYYGWHFYRDNGGTSVISNCVMNAANATAAIGVYAYEGPSVAVSYSSFINFPTNGDGFATCFRHGTNIATQAAMPDANLSWAGFPLDATCSASQDSDGDGLSDYDEIHEYDTDPLQADSDGDGVPDDAEIEVQTDPRDVTAFVGVLRVSITNTVHFAGVTNYAYAGTAPCTGNELFSCSSCGFTTNLVYGAVEMLNAMCVFQDLNRNGQYDESSDVLLVKECSGTYSVRNASFTFGDVDQDGVTDVQERVDGTDPYSRLSLKISRKVKIENKDPTSWITNYYFVAASPDLSSANWMWSTGMTVKSEGQVSDPATDGCLYAVVYRDFNCNGVFDEGVDAISTNRIVSGSGTLTFLIGDADGDGQLDSIELSHGTCPLDGENYCFNLAFVENGIFCTTNRLTAEVLFGTNVLVGPVSMTNRTWMVDLGHLTTTSRESVMAYFWDDANSNGVRDVGECRVQQDFRRAISGHENIITNKLQLGEFDRDQDDIPDYWELLHADAGLSPTNAADALVDSDADGLINYHEYWTGCDPAVPDGSNTLISVCSRSVDDRIRGIVPSNAVDRFVNFFENGDRHVFVANTNFWLQDVDVSCVSVWNKGREPGSMTATAITRRHVIMADHWHVISNYYFVANGQVVTQHVEKTYRVRDSDLLLGRLDADLPETIHVPNILSQDLLNSIADCKYLPAVCMNNRKAATVLELDSLNCSVAAKGGAVYRLMGKTSAENVVSSERVSLWASTVVGNSSSPVFLLAGNELIFLFSKHLGHNEVGASAETWGPVVSYRLDIIQNKINEWEGTDANEYQISIINAFGDAK